MMAIAAGTYPKTQRLAPGINIPILDGVEDKQLREVFEAYGRVITDLTRKIYDDEIDGRSVRYTPTGNSDAKGTESDLSYDNSLGYIKTNSGWKKWSLTPVDSDIVTVPSGAILPYGAASAPTGYLLCDGTAVSRTTYATLFAVISTTYGSGDGSTTFNVPDLRQKFPLGKAASGTGSTLGGIGGAIDHTHTGPSHNHSGTTGSHTLTTTETPSHTHSIAAHSHTVMASTEAASSSDPDGLYLALASGAVKVYRAAGTNQAMNSGMIASGGPTVTGSSGGGSGHTHTISSDGTGATGIGNPPFLSVQYVIKT